jgi:hypothetical protein
MTLGFVLIGVFIFCFTVFNKRTPEIEYEVFKRPEIDYIETFGEEDKFVLIQSSDGDIFPNGGLGQRYFVTDARRFDRASSSERPSEGWYWNVYIYDVEQKKPNAQKVDLYALVKKYDSSYYLGALGSVIYQNGQDYQILELRKWKGDSPTFVLLNLETHKIEDENPILQNLKSRYQYRLGDLIDGTNFYDILKERGASLDRDRLTLNSGSKLSEEINLSREYPEIIQHMEDDSQISSIGFRQGLVTAEEEYQILRHWFTPVGEKTVDIVTSEDYNENKILDTYKDYMEWQKEVSKIQEQRKKDMENENEQKNN